MIDREKVIRGLECCKEACAIGCCPYWNGSITDGSCMLKLHANALALLKEQEAVVRCEDCENWIPGYITDHDDFIPPKCGKYQQMVGHSAADYCSLAARKESR